jgi:transcription elongation factor Elf1
MPLTGPVPEGRSFFCPRCGALYSVTHSGPSKTDDSNIAKCVVCGHIMDKSDSATVRIYKLVHRPEDA